MHTNDTHGHLDNVAKRVTAVKEVRAEKPNALLLDAGDVFSGTLYFNEFQGMADLQFMNLMGYDAMTFGNHEFDLGSSLEGHQALVDFIEAAQFPFVSSNVDFSGDDKFTGLFSDLISSEPEEGKIYNGIIKEINGEKVGIFGLTTADTADISSPDAVRFSDYIEEAERAVAAFESLDVNKIIAVTHIGYDDNPAVDNDLILAATVDGIDVIVGGHSHSQLNEPTVIDRDETGRAKDPTLIVQAFQYNQFLGSLDVEFDKEGVISDFKGELIPVNEKVADPEAAAMLKVYSDRVEEVSNTETGAIAESKLENPRTSGDNTKPSVRRNETPLGNVITDGMLAKAKTYNPTVVMALQNGGGIRSAIEAGPITVGEVISVLPFGNTLATMDITGAELKEAFEISLRNYPGENGGFLHVSGAKVTFDSGQPVGERVVSIAYKNVDGTYTEISDQETYAIATNAFTAKGGDGYAVFAGAYEAGRVTDLGLSDWENFAEHLSSLGSVNPTIEGRIIDVAE
ncbi:bifunctional metallophosphatase/5'-nucleotidase [Sporosarcina sp. G11-34]|uniref:bifunctional metallophosphatase/5'-nucleotidase n=1 Tax=Sporosarcina sp. G11-34 TaxID=2849605 RepID=UPI003FA76D7A|nr:5'-nucleotidase C-terminal domain-containing protein [Sporosarcina sp. G11-34]